MSSYKDYIALIKRLSGQANLISVPRVYIDLCGDIETAAVLSQSVYWSDKTDDPEGWFYKSGADWQAEIGIKRHSLESAQSKLTGMGVLQTKLARAGKSNAPTTHHKIDDAVLADRLIDLLGGFAENSKSDLQKTANRLAENSKSSITEITTKSGDTSELFSIIDAYLRQTMNGTYARVQPVLKIDESPNVITIGVSLPQPALKAAIASLVAQVSKKKWRVKVIHTPAAVTGANLAAADQARQPYKQAYETAKRGPYNWTREHDDLIDALIQRQCTPAGIQFTYDRLAKDPYWSGKVVPFSVIVNNYTMPRAEVKPAAQQEYYA